MADRAPGDRYSSAVAAGEAFIEHYGIKGMKWGITRSNIPSLVRTGLTLKKTGVRNQADAKKYIAKSEDAKKAEELRLKTAVAGIHTLSNKDLQDVISRMNLEVSYRNLKKAEKDQSLLGRGKRWTANFVTDVLKDTAASWLKRPGSNFTGRTSARASSWIGQTPTIDGSFTPRALGR